MSSLTPTAQREYYTEIGNSLPRLVLDEPEYRLRRFTTAVETFNALRPGDAYEARLAVRIVLLGAHAVDGLREAGVYRDDFAKVTRCRAQAVSMMREERATRRTLAQEQKVRLATEAVAGSAPAQPAIPIPSAPPPQAEPRAAPPPVQAAAPASQPAPVAAPVPAAVPPRRPAATTPAPQPAAAESAPPPSPEAIAKAEAFAQEDIVAAAQIRHDRGVTPQNTAYLRHLTLPSDPALIDALVRGVSTVLTVLDEIGGEDLDTAA
jgi:hypothetical protein